MQAFQQAESSGKRVVHRSKLLESGVLLGWRKFPLKGYLTMVTSI
jgi:glucose-6-phosphate 1-epimerase